MARHEPVQEWAQMCRVLHHFGVMKDYSAAECYRIAKELKKLVAEGKVVKISRGRYRFLPPVDDRNGEE
ncbi:hypothetical protein IB263_10685 [Ensifer sp. ENS03]|nr:hypothetical protein [Ensifer sp. ENS08]MBD9556869.1 hypothetical protein [Ensifer sp. ENS03]MBD9568089.1 hypothetical protein [Ensifer sp. ENS08]SFF84881.1 hypothetical protein SAMN05216459_10279 [Ensifer sp. OV372]